MFRNEWFHPVIVADELGGFEVWSVGFETGRRPKYRHDGLVSPYSVQIGVHFESSCPRLLDLSTNAKPIPSCQCLAKPCKNLGSKRAVCDVTRRTKRVLHDVLGASNTTEMSGKQSLQHHPTTRCINWQKKSWRWLLNPIDTTMMRSTDHLSWINSASPEDWLVLQSSELSKMWHWYFRRSARRRNQTRSGTLVIKIHGRMLLWKPKRQKKWEQKPG